MRVYKILILGVLLMAGLWKIIIPFDADDVNEVTNPSLELNTTGYSGGTNTIAQSAEQQYRGKYSLKCTYVNSTIMVNYAITLATQNTTYYLRVWVYVPANWDGGNITLDIANLTGATPTYVKIFTNGTDSTATWIELETTLTVATDVTGSFTLTASSAPTAGRFIYMDGLYASTNNGEYFDGDDDMAFWTGDRHASTSKMDFRNRLHGEAVNLDDLNVFCGFPIGFDFTPPILNTRGRAFGEGEEYLSTYIPARTGQLPITVVGTDEANYYSRLKAFQNAVKHNRTPTSQPFVLRYLGANPNIAANLKCRLNSDLSLARDGYSGIGALRVLAVEPSFYEGGDNYLALTRSTSLSVSYVLGWLNDGTGFSALGNTGTGLVNALAIAENNDLYVGGDFLNWDAIANADYLVRFNRNTVSWSALFSPANGVVHDLLVLDDGDLLIVGDFTSIGGSALNRAARWDGTAISGFGTGFNGSVRVMKFDYKRGIIYFGGGFTTANGVTVNRVAKYTLSTGVFTAMDSGTTGGVVNAMVIDQATGDVYIGGTFTAVGAAATTVNRIAKWKYSTQAWQAIGNTATPGFNDQVTGLEIGNKGRIYVGGVFTEDTAGQILNYVAYFDTVGLRKPISRLGPFGKEGVNNFVFRVIKDAVTGKILFTGGFTATTAGLVANNAVLWNGSTFESLGLDFPGSPSTMESEQNKNGDYYYGFSTTGTMVVPSALNSITNNGTTDAYPIFVFESIGTTIGTDNARLDIIANRTTGKQINFNGLNLIEGSLIIVDTWRQRVYRIVGQTKADLTEGVIRRDSDWSDFILTPGVNEIMIAAPDVTGTPTINAYLLFRKRHNSLSGVAE